MVAISISVIVVMTLCWCKRRNSLTPPPQQAPTRTSRINPRRFSCSVCVTNRISDPTTDPTGSEGSPALSHYFSLRPPVGPHPQTQTASATWWILTFSNFGPNRLPLQIRLNSNVACSSKLKHRCSLRLPIAHSRLRSQRLKSPLPYVRFGHLPNCGSLRPLLHIQFNLKDNLSGHTTFRSVSRQPRVGSHSHAVKPPFPRF